MCETKICKYIFCNFAGFIWKWKIETNLKPKEDCQFFKVENNCLIESLSSKKFSKCRFEISKISNFEDREEGIKGKEE